MTSVLYEFDTLVHSKPKNNIFQFVKDRKLTNIYHSHDFYELICFLKGRGTQIINEEEILSEEKTVTLLCPDDKHCFIDQSDDVEIISLSVRREYFKCIRIVLRTTPLHLHFSYCFKAVRYLQGKLPDVRK